MDDVKPGQEFSLTSFSSTISVYMAKAGDFMYLTDLKTGDLEHLVRFLTGRVHDGQGKSHLAFIAGRWIAQHHRQARIDR